MQPLMIELIGEPAVGKTHLASSFPKPFVIDTTPKMEARAIVAKVLGEGWNERYAAIRDYRELLRAVDAATKREDVATVVIDTGADLQSLAASEYLRRKREEEHKERERVLPVEYGRVRDMVDNEIINRVIRAEKNLILTAQMKDEYVEGKKTGRRVRDGYPRANYLSDIRILIKIVEEKAGDKTVYKRVGLVVKNRFIDVTSEDYVWELNPLTVEAVLNLAIKGGVPREEIPGCA